MALLFITAARNAGLQPELRACARSWGLLSYSLQPNREQWSGQDPRGLRSPGVHSK